MIFENVKFYNHLCDKLSNKCVCFLSIQFKALQIRIDFEYTSCILIYNSEVRLSGRVLSK